MHLEKARGITTPQKRTIYTKVGMANVMTAKRINTPQYIAMQSPPNKKILLVFPDKTKTKRLCIFWQLEKKSTLELGGLMLVS